MTQTILFNVTMLGDAIQSNEALDGVIFAYMIKATFVSGRINNATQAKMCSVLGMGNRLLKRCLKSALKHGYVRQEGKDIISNNLKERLCYVNPLRIERKRLKDRKIGESPRCPFKYIQLRKIIREFVIENHISKQNDFCHTIECQANPHSDKELKRAKKRIKRMGKSVIAENPDRLSNRRVMKVANLKRTTAKSIMRGLVLNKRISKTPNIEQTEIDVQKELGMSYTEPYFRSCVKRWVYNYAQHLDKGYPVLEWRYLNESNCRLMASIQYANSYSLRHDNIRLFL